MKMKYFSLQCTSSAITCQ